MSRSPADTKAPFTRSTARSSGSELSQGCAGGERGGALSLCMATYTQPHTFGTHAWPGSRAPGTTAPAALPAATAPLGRPPRAQPTLHSSHQPPSAPPPTKAPRAPGVGSTPHLRRQQQGRGRLELVVQHRLAQLLAAALAGVPHALVAANGVVREHSAAPCTAQRSAAVEGASGGAQRDVRCKVQRIRQGQQERRASCCSGAARGAGAGS